MTEGQVLKAKLKSLRQNCRNQNADNKPASLDECNYMGCGECVNYIQLSDWQKDEFLRISCTMRRKFRDEEQFE